MKHRTSTLIELDGSVGEGGGQILRTALSLSAVTGQPFRLEKIRAGRPKPGLMRQHLACVQAAAAVCGAKVTGAEPRSTTLEFVPGKITPGTHSFAVGSAGSALLVAQTVLPVLWQADAPSEVTLRGGTHNPFAPPFEFVRHAFLPPLAALGARVELSLRRPGFMPAGGGELSLSVSPAEGGAPLRMLERGAHVSRRVTAILSDLPSVIGERELETVRRELGLSPEETAVDRVPDPAGPGNALVGVWTFAQATAVFCSLGAHDRRADEVGRRLAGEASAWLAAEAPVDAHLADQLLLPCALRHGGEFRATGWTPHAETNAAIIRRFLPHVSITATRAGRLDWHVKVEGK